MLYSLLQMGFVSAGFYEILTDFCRQFFKPRPAQLASIKLHQSRQLGSDVRVSTWRKEYDNVSTVVGYIHHLCTRCKMYMPAERLTLRMACCCQPSFWQMGWHKQCKLLKKSIGGRSQTTLTRFCLFLTTAPKLRFYLINVDQKVFWTFFDYLPISCRRSLWTPP